MAETFIFELSRRTKKGHNTLKKGNQMISANDRLHHHVKATITSYLRQLPSEYEWDAPQYDKKRPCIVTIDVQPPTKRRMDAPNWYPTVKALIDGDKVAVNSAASSTSHYQVSEGDVISVRGFGKFIFYGSLGKTKKDRLQIHIGKYC
mgnify:CR=1 FL=1